MPTARQVLDLLTRDELLRVVDQLGVLVGDRRQKAHLADRLEETGHALPEALADLSRDRLKELCRALGLDDGGKEKAGILARIVGATSGGEAAPRAKGEKAARGKSAGADLLRGPLLMTLDPALYPLDGPGVDDKRRMLDLMQRAHAHQTRNGGRVPYWVHPQGVAEILDQALRQSGELPGDEALARDIYLAAQGHDLFEDTAVTPDAVREAFGERVCLFMQQMTNEGGDADRAAYLAKMRAAPDEVRLIKLADLLDNTLSCAYGVHDLGVAWIRQFFLPIVVEMKDVLAGAELPRYPGTAKLLRDALELAHVRLVQNADKLDRRATLHTEAS
jgi:hypothetical protein